MTAEELNALSKRVLDAAYAVHTALGPGLLESTYSACLIYEMEKRGLNVRNEVPVPVVYDGQRLADVGYKIDMLINNQLVLELKALEAIAPVHQAQLLSYLKHSKRRLGLLINFNVMHLKDGIYRKVNRALKRKEERKGRRGSAKDAKWTSPPVSSAVFPLRSSFGLGRGYLYVLVGGFPADVEFGGVFFDVVEGDAHDFLGAGESFRLHLDATEVLLHVVFGAPLAGLLVDDEHPFGGGGQGVDGVGAGGDEQGADVQRDRRDEGGGGVRAGAPDFVPGDDFGGAEMTAAEMRGVVFDGDVGAGEGDGGGGGRAGHVAGCPAYPSGPAAARQVRDYRRR